MIIYVKLIACSAAVNLLGDTRFSALRMDKCALLQNWTDNHHYWSRKYDSETL